MAAITKATRKVSRYDSNKKKKKKKIMITDSFKMADVFVGDRTGGAVAQTSAQMIGISMWQGRMWLSRLQGMHGSRWWVVVRAKSAIVDPRDAAVAARGWCSISFLKTNKGSLTTKSPIQNQCHYRLQDTFLLVESVATSNDRYQYVANVISRLQGHSRGRCEGKIGDCWSAGCPWMMQYQLFKNK